MIVRPTRRSIAALLFAVTAPFASAQEPTPTQPPPVGTAAGTESESSVRTMLDGARLDLVELRFEQSLATLESLLARADLTLSERIEGWVVRSQAHVAFGDLDAAEEDYRQLLRLQPAFVPDSSLTPGKAMERYRRVRGALIGELVVDVQPPDAEISIDGIPVALTAQLALPMLVGEHRLRAARAGFDAAEAGVIVEAGKSTHLNLRLVPNSRTLVVRTDPADVEVRIDGRLIGRTTAVIGADGWKDAKQPAQLVVESVPLGEHVIELSKPCYRDKRSRELLTVDLVDWSPRLLAPSVLVPVSSTLVVVGGTPGAEILVDGERMSRTPSAPIELCPGERRLEIRHGSRRIWTQSLLLEGDRESVVRLAARPNVLILGEGEWPAALMGMASSFNFEGRPQPTMLDLEQPRSWEALPLADDVDLVFARRSHEGRELGWWLYSPHLRQLSAIDDPPSNFRRPDWQAVTWGLALADSDRFGPALVATVAENGPAAKAGVLPGVRLMSLGGSQVTSAAQAQRLLSAASTSAPLAAEWVSHSGHTGHGQMEGRVSPSLDRPGSDPTQNAVRAAWAAVDAATAAEGAAIARANLALLQAQCGMHDEAAEHWRKVSLDERAGIGRGTVAYYLGCALQALGRPAEAIEAFRQAADSNATAFHDEGPPVAAPARDRLREIVDP